MTFHILTQFPGAPTGDADPDRPPRLSRLPLAVVRARPVDDTGYAGSSQTVGFPHPITAPFGSMHVWTNGHVMMAACRHGEDVEPHDPRGKRPPAAYITAFDRCMAHLRAPVLLVDVDAALAVLRGAFPVLTRNDGPADAEAPPCPSCAGAGVVECDRCEGKGEWECTCPDCDDVHTVGCSCADGVNPCPDCAAVRPGSLGTNPADTARFFGSPSRFDPVYLHDVLRCFTPGGTVGVFVAHSEAAEVASACLVGADGFALVMGLWSSLSGGWTDGVGVTLPGTVLATVLPPSLVAL